MTRWLPISLAVLARSVVLGWATLFLALFAMERPLLLLMLRLLGGGLIPVVRLPFECVALAGGGWVAGRLSRPNPLPAVLILALTVTFWDFGGMLDIQIPWLLRLVADGVGNSRYWGSALDVLLTHVFLFGCLIAGALLSRPRQAPLSIASPQ